MKKYSTSVDERNFLTVYEYSVNNQWIIWDYYTGYVHFTGIWKAIGNLKADIVKLIDNSPELEPDIRRVRGGFLKIQGTWLTYPIARKLASRTCYHIRYALVPLFGPSFPDSCLQPHEPGFGQLQMTLVDPAKRRRRRSTVSRANSGIVVASSPSRGENKPGPMRHRHSYSAGSINPLPLEALHHHHAVPPHPHQLQQQQQQQQHQQRQQQQALSSSLHYNAYLSRHEHAIADSSLSDDELPPVSHPRAQPGPRRHTIEPPMMVEPPKLPPRIAFSDDNIVDHPKELLEVLQATRSLQQISAGNAGRRWSANRRSFGGGFECSGHLWKWDGQEDLSLVGAAAKQAASVPDSPHSIGSPISLHPQLAKRSDREQRRSFTGATPRVLPSAMPWSPPSSPPVRANRELPIPGTTRQVMDITRFLS